MKKSLPLLLSTIALLTGTSALLAFKASKHEPLPNFDARVHAVELSDEKRGAADKLKAMVPNAEIRIDKQSGIPDFVSSSSHFLSGPNGVGGAISAEHANAIAASDRHRAVKAFLNEHSALYGYGAEALSAAHMKTDAVLAHNGMRTTAWQQQYDDLPVFDTILIGNITKQGELVNLATKFLPDLKKAAATGLRQQSLSKSTPKLTAAEAIVQAAKNIKQSISENNLTAIDNETGTQKVRHYKANAALKGQIDTRLVWVPMDADTMRLAWQVILAAKDRGETFLFIVDASSGDVIIRRCLTQYISDATYNVYTSDSPSPFSPGLTFPGNFQPALVPRSLLTLQALDTTASPNGWINDGDNETLGNNVDAHTDWDNDDLPDLPRPQGTNRVFDFPLDLTKNPTNYSDAAVVQLFYWNNFMHDKLYQLGFTEQTGNFQTDNFGRGGIGGDAVSADGQDGGGYDNANMSTLPDGTPPRMQMYLFPGPDPARDGDLDAEVICHEYTHGLSNRRVGGGVLISELQSAGMGEGWSDFYALALLSASSDNVDANYPQGGYVTYKIDGSFTQNYYYGIRRYPYSTDMTKNPLTFKDIDPTKASSHPGIPRSPISGGPADEVHNMGEVWCVTLWDVRAAIIKKYGYSTGNTLALQLVTDAMTLSPVNPNFLQARNAIILADKVDTGGANYGLLWTAFAKRGMGGSATSPDSSTAIGVVEAFDFPGLSEIAAHSDDSLTGNNNGTVDPNECNYIYVTIQNGGTNLATGISATLSTTTPGVTVDQSDSAYPDLPAGGAGANKTPYRIYTSPSFQCGTPITFEFVITSGAAKRTNSFNLKTGYISTSPIVYSSSTAVAIPDANSAGVDSPISINNFSGNVGKTTVSLYITHTFDFDLTLQLIAPDGTTVTLARNVGGGGQNFGANCSPQSSRTTFDDGAATSISGGSAPFIGTFQPAEPLQNFAGVNANGTWRLHVVDRFSQDTGTIQCWSLNLFPTVCSDGGGGCGSDVRVSATGPATISAGSNAVYSVVVTNSRVIPATSITLTNTLPAGFNFVSATTTQGAFTTTNGTLIGAFGTLTNGASITATITVTPTVAGTFTNQFGVTSANDVNAGNNIASVVTSVTAASPLIAAAGAQLTAESTSPANGSIDAGETVTVNLALRNNGTSSTSNLVATLLAIGGVNSPSGAQSYGVLTAGGSSVTRPFTFTASGFPGTTITATLQLQDGATSLGTVSFSFGVGASTGFANSSAITINDGTAASPYPSTINVSGLTGVVSKVTVNLIGFTHSFPDDVDVLLVSPSGQKVLLMSDVGGQVGANNLSLTFDSSAASGLPDNGPLTSGTFLPTDYQTGDAFSAPAPAGPYGTNLDAFKATNPNGLWSLYVMDDSASDAGAITGGWSLSIATVVPVNTNADLSVSIAASANPAPTGVALAYTITVANAGPNTATGVVLTNTLPVNATYNFADTTQGTVGLVSGKVVANIGNLASGATATVHVIVTPTSGSLTSSAQVSANELDLNTSNNSASVTTATRAPVADLAVRGSGAASVLVGSNLVYTLSVTNAGPDGAANVVLSNSFSANTTFVSATTSQGTVTNIGAAVVASLGSLAANGNAVVTVTMIPTTAGTLINTINVTSSISDTNTANNSTNVAVNVITPSPTIIAAGSALVSESFTPANNAIEPGETVVMNLAVRNVGTGPTTSLVATLQNSGGITPISGSANYGVVAAGGASVSRQFTFVANGSGTVTATLTLQDGATSLGAVTFNFVLSSVQKFGSGGVIIIPSSGAASPYASTLSVSGITGVVSKVTAVVSNISHTFPEDIDMLLVGPSGQKVLLMSDAGAGNPISNVTLNFDDSGSALPLSTVITAGTYAPTDYSPGDTFPSPAPAGPYGTLLSGFNGINPNGTWSLYVADDSIGDAGRIDGGWALSFLVAKPVTNSADIGLSGSATPATTTSGSNITYSVTVNNPGPGTANNVVVSDVIPAGCSIVSSTMSQGTGALVGNTLNFNVGALAVGNSATITLLLSSTTVGSLTNSFVVSATEPDLNSSNNSSQFVTMLTPAPARFAGGAIVTNRTFQLTFSGQVGWTYVIEGSTNLVNWVPVFTNTVNSGGTIQFTDQNSPSLKYRFYRAHVQ